MSKYDDASLIMFPSGYKEDKIYSLKPTDGSGDLTFTRASTATRVNSDGLIETASVLGSEEITNGDFDGNANNWTLDSGVTYGDNNLVFATDSNQKATQTQTFTVGKTYRVSIELVAYTSGIITVRMGSVPQVITTDIGVKTWDIIATGNLARIEGTFGIGVSATIDNVSVKEVITNNVPRIDYTGGGCGKLLLEPQRTNLFTYSSEFDNAAWGKTTSGSAAAPVVTANYAISPDGTQNADRVYFDAVGVSSSDRSGLVQNFAFTTGQVYTISAYAKSATGVNQILQFRVAGVQVGGELIATSEWQRFNVTFTATATTTDNFGIQLRGDNTSNESDLILYGLQLELGSYSTSYIKSEGAATTRLADSCSKTGISSLIGQTEGVLFVDFQLNQAPSDTNGRLLQLWATNDTTNSILPLVNQSNQFQLAIFGSASGGAIIPASASTLLGLGQNKIAVAYTSTSFVVYRNGVLFASGDPTGFFPTSLTSLDLGGSSFAARNLSNPVNQAILFKTALSDNQLADLTGGNKTTFNALAEFYGYQIL